LKTFKCYFQEKWKSSNKKSSLYLWSNTDWTLLQRSWIIQL